MQLRLLSLFVLVALLPLASSAGDKKVTSFRNVKIGDYANYRVSTFAMGKESCSTDFKLTVTARDGDIATVKMIGMRDGKELVSATTRYDLSKTFDPAFALQLDAKAKFETKANGKERTKIGDKTYDCTWISGKVVIDLEGCKEEFAAKFWISDKLVPIGLVKAEMRSDLDETRLLIVDYGNEK